ncbi:MAG: VOC family protein, partial [bacterium]
LVVSDIEAAHAELEERGVDVSEIFHRAAPGKPPVSGRDPAGGSYVSFATFSDPDGNSWLLQEITARLPGRVESDTSFASAAELVGALRRAEAAHGEHEKRLGHRDAEWPEWYAEYIVNQQAGRALPT